MSSGSGLTGAPLQPQGSFNWVYLVELIVSGILALFFLFYFNRVFATLLAYGIRFYTWHKFRVYIDIDALQISLLAGRVFFKGIRYHGENETILVHGGYITWRYWLRKVKECQIYSERLPGKKPAAYSESSEDGGRHPTDAGGEVSNGNASSKTLPCRISVDVSGVEAFIYNRSPAYDIIIDGIQQSYVPNMNAQSQAERAQHAEKTGFAGLRSRKSGVSSESSASSAVNGPRSAQDKYDPDFEKVENSTTSHSDHTDGNLTQYLSVASEDPPSLQIPFFLHLLPIVVKCNKGAVVLGNENTPSIISAKFASASGEFDASASGPLDIFKILMNFDAAKPFVQMKPNVDYKKPQLAEAADLKSRDGGEVLEPTQKRDRPGRLSHFFTRSFLKTVVNRTLSRRRSSGSIFKASHGLEIFSMLPNTHSPLPGQHRWHGLTRYLDDGQNQDHDEWNAVEYAKASILADCTRVTLKVYWDVPGNVPLHASSSYSDHPTKIDDINGAIPPEYGMEIAIFGGFVNYGPWADRQRIGLQEMFFPAPHVNARPASKIKPLQSRVCTEFKLFLSIEGDTTVRIPFREASKDFRWKGKASDLAKNGNGASHHNKMNGKARKRSKKTNRRSKTGTAGEVRPFAWFDIRVSSDTTVTYTMDMVPDSKGYRNRLNVDVRGLSILSSLNHGLLWQSQRVAMNCDLSNPLCWNGLREWYFGITISDLDFFLLRDHTFLLVDLISDWSSGPPSDFYTFAPYRYTLDVDFRNFKLFLNTNDANVINNHADLEDNNFVILYGDRLNADLIIPLDRLRPSQNEIIFNVESTGLGFELCPPPKNTTSTLLLDKKVAKLEHIHLDGSYTYCSEVAPGLTETLYLNVIGSGLVISFYGFFARHLVRVKENYFGDDLHFRTAEEYQDLLRDSPSVRDSKNPDNPAKTSNDLDVILDITAESPTILMPSHLYESTEHIHVKVATVKVDLRVSNYYLELMVNSSPVEIGHTAGSKENRSNVVSSSTEICVSGVKVYGHRFFGLPPKEPAYVSNWDIDGGFIVGECSSSFLAKAITAGQSFAFTFKDSDNAMPLNHIPDVHDATFVQFHTSLIRLWLQADQEAILFQLDGVRGQFNDFAGRTFSQRLNLYAPGLVVAFVNTRSLLHKGKEGDRSAETHAALKTDVNLDMVQRNYDFELERSLQQAHLDLHDNDYHRAAFLLQDLTSKKGKAKSASRKDVESPSIPLPSLPPPAQSRGPTDRRRLRPEFPPSEAGNDDTDFDVMEFIDRQGPRLSGEGKDSHPLASQASDLGNLEPNLAERSQIPSSHQSAAFSSPYAMPYFPLSAARPDLTELPAIRTSAALQTDGNEPPSFNDPQIAAGNGTHTSLLVRADSGISLFCKPKAVHAILFLIKALEPTTPRELLDSFHFSVLSEALAKFKIRSGITMLLDLSIRIPYLHARIINEFESSYREVSDLRRDYYDVILEQASSFTRLKKMPASKGKMNSVAVHLHVKSLTASAREGPDLKHNDTAFKTVLKDVLVWLADESSTLVHVSVQEIETVLTSKKVEYLGSLIHRTTMVAEGFAEGFEDVFATRRLRLRYFIYRLIMLGGNNPGPPFLTRPSYFLRAQTDHLRNTDSWRIISRLQYMYQSLSQEDQRLLMAECVEQFHTYPAVAEAFVLANLDQWHGWDTINIKESIAVRALYGSIGGIKGVQEQSTLAVGVAARAEHIKIIIDPGLKQNELLIDGLAIYVSVSQPQAASGLMLVDAFREENLTVVHTNISRITLGLRWEMCDLVDEVLTIFQNSALKGQDGKNLRPTKDETKKNHVTKRFQIVVTMDTGIVNVETTNLTHEARSSGLKLSFTGHGWSTQDQTSSVNGLLSAETISTRLFGHRRLLWRSEMLEPCLWVAYDLSKANGGISDALKVAGNSSAIRLLICDEMIGLFEICNSVIGEEVSYFQRLAQKHSRPGLTSSTEHNSTPPERTTTVKLALFLNELVFQVPLVKGLIYRASGEVVRLSVSPASNENPSLRFEYDLKTQAHKLLNEQRELSSLVLPAINGTMRVLNSTEAISISAMGTIEQISFGGSEIYGIVRTLSSNDTYNALTALKDDILVVSENLKQVLNPQETHPPISSTKPGPSKLITYDIRLALGGFSITADAPTASKEAGTSILVFELGSAFLKASNSDPSDGSVLPLPNITASLQQTTISVRQTDNRGTKNCGYMRVSVILTSKVEKTSSGASRMRVRFHAVGPDVGIFVNTLPAVIAIVSHSQQRFKDIDLPSGGKQYLRRLHQFKIFQSSAGRRLIRRTSTEDVELNQLSAIIQNSTVSVEVEGFQLSWIVGDSVPNRLSRQQDDLVLSFKQISLLTRSESDARLKIEELLLQIVPAGQAKEQRSANSALLPEVIFNVGQRKTSTQRQMVFHAAGKALDIQLEPHFVLPANDIERSITISGREARRASANLVAIPGFSNSINAPGKPLFGTRKLSALVLDADFAGAVVSLQGRRKEDMRRPTIAALHLDQVPQYGRYNQFAAEGSANKAVFRSPGITIKVHYTADGIIDPSLNVELRVNESVNILHPAVVPLFIQISEGVKKVVREPYAEGENEPTLAPTKSANRLIDEDSIVAADPRAVLGKTKLNIGLRICRQEFALSCQPIAKVAATAKVEDFYVTISTVDSVEKGSFFSATAAITGLNASLKHVYSREPTFSFDIDMIVLSIMNSKHHGGSSGVSAILKVYPARTHVNAKQMQDILLFREIWIPLEMRHTSDNVEGGMDPQDYFVHRYQQIAASTAFRWNATVAIAELGIELDLGQAIGKTSFNIKDLWATSKKSSTAHQNLCIGIGQVAMRSSGRMSGYIELEKVKVRTSITWPSSEEHAKKTPLIQLALGFDQLRVKAAFDYQAFAVLHVNAFEFIMYNVQDHSTEHSDRLVAILDGDKVRACCISTSASLILSLFQAFERLGQEMEAAYEQSLREIEKFLRRRKQSVITTRLSRSATIASGKGVDKEKIPISLHTDVIVSFRTIDLGAFPNTLFDRTILRLEAGDVQARFAVALEDEKIHSKLGMTLGQLRVSLATLSHPNLVKPINEINVEEIVSNTKSARGGVILRVPKVLATMQTWQGNKSNSIDYIFKSSFEGKIDVGWNYSRVSFIRGMWATHTRTLAARLGKPLPEPAVKITGAPEASINEKLPDDHQPAPQGDQQKITAVVNLPQSKYNYRALEPPVIDTPQLRDMGDATPPLEWIGLHRDRLPNITHQIIIVTLLEVAKEAEDAYSRILGSA